VQPRSSALLLALLSLLPTALACGASALPETQLRAVTSSQPDAEPTPMSTEALMAHVEYLAAPELEGRRAGSRGERRAAQYITEQLERWGLPPVGSRRSHAFSLEGARGAGGDASQNVYALVEPTSADALREVVVLGAHFDHVGIVRGELYPGAEDNASGVAVTLEVARALLARRAELRRSVVFAFFGAEEIGLHGSRAFIREPPVPLDRIAAMVNLDMIGRPLVDHPALAWPKLVMGIRSYDSVGVIGVRSRPHLRALVVRACRAQDLTVVGPGRFSERVAQFIEATAQGRADHTSFEEAGIPAVFFSSGESVDYHRPTDVPAELAPELMRRRALAIADTIVELTKTPWGSIRATAEPAAEAVDPAL